MKLNKNDYISILNYYNINYSNYSFKNIKKLAEEIIADKLCSCIKNVYHLSNNKTKSIAICRSIVINKKGYKINRFTCKKKNNLYNKKSKNKIFK